MCPGTVVSIYNILHFHAHSMDLMPPCNDFVLCPTKPGLCNVPLSLPLNGNSVRLVQRSRNFAICTRLLLAD